jgi:hypothetical protein
LTSKDCARCGATFTPISPKAIYCSRKCNDAAHYARVKPHLKRKCSRCGVEYFAKVANRSTFCSRGCSDKAKNERSKGTWIHWWFRTCEVCGERFVTNRRTARLCRNTQCWRADARNKARASFKPSRNPKPCSSCGSPTGSESGYQKLCGDCSLKRKRRFKRDRNNPRSRAKSANVIYATVSRSKIISKHGARCWLCREQIDMEISVPHPRAFSIDHVVPLSLGGWHDLLNLRPAHFQCNVRRGSTYSGQLMLRPMESTG